MTDYENETITFSDEDVYKRQIKASITLKSNIMGKNLIHSNELHLIDKKEIHNAAKKMVESLNLAAGSTGGFDIYKVVETYFTDLDKRHAINQLIGIGEDCAYYGAQEQAAECEKAEAANE